MYLFITGAGLCTAHTKLINKEVLLSGVYINQVSLTSDCVQQSPPSCLCLKMKSLLMAMLYENKRSSVGSLCTGESFFLLILHIKRSLSSTWSMITVIFHFNCLIFFLFCLFFALTHQQGFR